MSSSPATPIRTAWYKWKALRLPWRKRFLVGLDLQGNTFWEFRDTFSSHKHRMRRIVKYPPTVQYSDLNISPSWHQWLRHTRQDPPSITEQSEDIIRQQNLKVLVAQADARWAVKPSYLDNPRKAEAQPLLSTQIRDPGGYGQLIEPRASVGSAAVRGVPVEDVRKLDTIARETIGEEREVVSKTRSSDRIQHRSEEKTKHRKEAPYGPGEEWQPEAWNSKFTATKRSRTKSW
jgi:NADH dehydrogenase [ubiquinone] 1 alpha subcomplex assembly factor 2